DGGAGALDQLHVLPNTLAAVSRAIGQRQLEAREAELHVLLDVVAGAVGGDAVVDASAQQPPDRGVPNLAGEAPQRQIDAGDGVYRPALTRVRHGRAPHDVPQPLDVERIFAHSQLGEVVFGDHAAGRAV